VSFSDRHFPRKGCAVTAGELFRAGRLKEAIEAQVQEVKTQPLDQGKRLFLFELLVFAGELDRARRQIDAVTYEDVHLELATGQYRKLFEVEQARHKLRETGPLPRFLSPPPEHARLRLEALENIRLKRFADATTLLEQADDKAPELKGTLNDKPFTVLRDCDDLFGSVIEMVVQGQYYWVPLEEIGTCSIREPKNPRDLIWCPARVQLKQGSGGDVFLPALYPGSHASNDDALRLGRATDWSSGDDGPVRGIGARQFLVEEDAINLVDWRELKVND
jgi:type VI secretion system protein ImpE